MAGLTPTNDQFLAWAREHKTELANLLGLSDLSLRPGTPTVTYPIRCTACDQDMYGLWWDDEGRCQRCVDANKPAQRPWPEPPEEPPITILDLHERLKALEPSTDTVAPAAVIDELDTPHPVGAPDDLTLAGGTQ